MPIDLEPRDEPAADEPVAIVEPATAAAAPTAAIVETAAVTGEPAAASAEAGPVLPIVETSVDLAAASPAPEERPSGKASESDLAAWDEIGKPATTPAAH